MKKIVLIFISTIMGISMMAQNANTLKLNLEKNKVYRLKSTSEQMLTQTINGVAQTTNIKSGSVVSIKLKDATPDFIIVEVKFDTIISNTNAMGKTMLVSSAIEGNIKSEEITDVMSCIMNRMSKNALYLKMDYSGKLLEIVNLKMFSDMVAKDTALIPGAMAPMIKTQVKNTIDEKALRTMVETLTHNLPQQEVKADKWTNTEMMNAGGMSLDITSSYILESLKDNAAIISVESNIQTSPNAEPLIYGGAKISYDDIKGLAKSNLVIDIRTGLIIESKSKSHLSGNLNVEAQGMNMQIPMEIDNESTVVTLP
jgi:hypothetical protein